MKLNNDFLMRSRVETEEHWREWCGKLPYLHFKEKYEVKIIPPFAGALVRFVVKYNDKSVSVYFDGYSELGWMYDNNLRFSNNPDVWVDEFFNHTRDKILLEYKKKMK